jgi:hypothetical protein
MARPACHDRLILRGLKKYAHVYSRTHDWMTGVNSIFRNCVSDVMFLGQMFLRTSPRQQHSECATLAPLPSLLALDLIIVIRPWQNRGELSSDLPGQGHYAYRIFPFFEFFTEQSPIASIGFEVIQSSEWKKLHKCYFCIHFTFTNHMVRRIGTV